MHVSHSLPSPHCYKNALPTVPENTAPPKAIPESTQLELRRERSEYSSESRTQVVGENSIQISDVSVEHTYERLSFRSSENSSGNSSAVNTKATKSAEITGNSVSGVSSTNNPVVNDTANTILGFIEDRILKDRAEGASQEDIESRLQAGLDGFKKGFAEAKEQLEALGMLSGDNNVVADKINDTYERVVSGIENFRHHIISTHEAENVATDTAEEVISKSPANEPVGSDLPVSPDHSLNTSSKASVINTFHQGNVFNRSTENSAKLSSFNTVENKSEASIETDVSLMESFRKTSNLSGVDSLPNAIHRQHGVQNSFSFQVETADGDKVTITAETTDASAGQYYQMNTLFGQNDSLGRYVDQDSHFSMNIEGELDEDELNALGDLLNKVENLSINFFEGDLDLAFNQATSLGYDANEIVGFSLNLKHTEIEKVRSSYQEFLPDGEAIQPVSLVDQLQPVGLFAKDLMDAAQIASTFKESHSLIVELASHFEKQHEKDNSFEDRFSSFVKDLLGSEV